MADRRSAAISIGKPAPGAGGDPFDVSLLSQSLPCKPRSYARPMPSEDEPPPLELPKSSPAHDPIVGDTEKGRTLIRYNADITAEEFTSTPVQRAEYLSQSCPNWSTFQMPEGERPSWLPERAPTKEEPVEGAMAVPGHVAAVEAAIEAEGIIGKSPTILETFKLYNASASVEDDISKLEDINEEEALVEDNGDDDEDQFALDA